MSLPFSAREFFEVFARYNLAVWPAQVALFALAAAGILLLRHRARSLAIMLVLATLWLWMGVAYHAAFFAAVNPVARIFAAAFVAQALLFARAGWKQRVEVAVPPGAASVGGWLLLAYALVGYPLVALAAGQRWPALPTFGLPCPTTIYTLAILSWSRRVPWTLLVVPLGWAVVATSAAMQLGVVEDYGLTTAAAAFVAERMWRHRAGGPARRFA